MSLSFSCQPKQYNIGFTRDIYNDDGKRVYCREELLGEGTYGIVYKAQNISTQEIVVIKQMKRFDEDDEGLQSTALREASLLKHLKHQHIVEVKDIFWTIKHEFCLVFEFCWMDLAKYIHIHKMDLQLIKKWSQQMICGICFMHKRRILHRDLKPQNILVTHSLNIKIGDLGLGKEHQIPIKRLTTEVVTLWYRSPELLLGTHYYAGKVDIWSLGLIIAEMARNQPLFIGESEWEIIIKIFQFYGTPNINDQNSIKSLQHFNKRFPKFKGIPFETKMGSLKNDKIGCDLLKKMLILDPKKRYNAIQLLKHPWFHGINIKENKKKHLNLNEINHGSDVNNAKWNEYFEIADINIEDTPKSNTNNLNHQSIISTMKISKCIRNIHTPNVDDDDQTLGIVNCDHCNGKHSDLMNDIFYLNQNKTPLLDDDSVFSSTSRRILSENEDIEATETEEDIDIAYNYKPGTNNGSMPKGRAKSTSFFKNGEKRKKPLLKKQSVQLPFQDITKKYNAITTNHKNVYRQNRNNINDHSTDKYRNKTSNKNVNRTYNIFDDDSFELCKDNNKVFKTKNKRKRSRKEYDDENNCDDIEDVENINPTKRCRI